MKTAFSAFLFLISLFTLISCTSQKESQTSFEAMNTFMTIKIYGKNCRTAQKAAEAVIHNLENEVSATKPESCVYKINEASRTLLNNSINYDAESQTENDAAAKASGESSAVQKEKWSQIFNAAAARISVPDAELKNHTKTLLETSLKIAEETDGALNPFLYPVIKKWGFTTGNYRIPDDNQISNLLLLTDWHNAALSASELKMNAGMEMDFGALGKGYAGDLVIETLKNEGITSAILDLGGNVQLLGTKTDGSDWNIGLKSPWKDKTENTVIGALKVHDCAVITSGGYERFFIGEDGQRYIHIFDSKTGRPVNNGTASSTIVAEKGIYADALSTATFAMGKEKAIEFWRQNRNFEMILIFEDNSLIYTSGLKDKLTLLADFAKVEEIQ